MQKRRRSFFQERASRRVRPEEAYLSKTAAAQRNIKFAPSQLVWEIKGKQSCFVKASHVEFKKNTNVEANILPSGREMQRSAQMLAEESI